MNCVAGRRIAASALAILVVVLGSVVVGLWLLPRWVLVASGLAAALVGFPLVAGRRWPSTFDRAFAARVRVPNWFWLGILATGVVLAVLMDAEALGGWSIAWAGVVGFSLAIMVTTVATARRLVPRAVSVPVWLSGASITAVVGFAWAIVATGSVWAPLFLVALLTFYVYLWFVVPLAIYQRLAGDRPTLATEDLPTLSVLIPAYNEEGYVGRCIDHVLAADYPADRLEVFVVDDGSSDGTLAEATERADSTVTVYSTPNSGKHAALNYALGRTTGEVVVVVDADSFVEPTALRTVASDLLADSSVGALASDVRVVNRRNAVSRLQTLEYVLGIGVIRRAFDYFGAIPVVPGCLGAFRRQALFDAGGYDGDTLTEDFDLTVKVLKAGWTVEHTAATVWTEAPYSWHDLYRQRLRWYRGNVEVMWKHADVLLGDETRALHRFVFPFSLVTTVLSPVVGILVVGAVVASALSGNLTTVAGMLAYFLVVSGMLTGAVLRLDGEPLRLLPYIIPLVVVYPLFQALVITVSVFAVLRNGDRDWASVRRMAQDPTAERV